MTVRLVPLSLVLLWLGIGFGWRAWLQWRRYGGSGIMLFRSGRWMQHLRELGLVALSAMLIGQAAHFSFSPAVLERVALGSLAAAGVRFWSGVGLFAAGTVLMVVAQLDLGASWRVGFDTRNRPGLVTDGLYGLVRNPIYLALFVVLVGYLGMIPTWISLLLTIGTFVGIRVQVLDEEAFLTRTYGTAYRDYARRVGRFLPGVGCLV